MDSNFTEECNRIRDNNIGFIDYLISNHNSLEKIIGVENHQLDLEVPCVNNEMNKFVNHQIKFINKGITNRVKFDRLCDFLDSDRKYRDIIMPSFGSYYSIKQKNEMSILEEIDIISNIKQIPVYKYWFERNVNYIGFYKSLVLLISLFDYNFNLVDVVKGFRTIYFGFVSITKKIGDNRETEYIITG